MDNFAFDAEFQRKIVKLALIDDGFCTVAAKYIKAEMFESDGLRWCWRTLAAEREAKRTPTMLVLRDRLRQVEQVLQPRYRAMLDSIEQDVLREDQYIRHALGEFVRRNMFVSAYGDSQRIYNMGRPQEAIDAMRVSVDQIQAVSFQAPSRYWFYDDLDERQRRRQRIAESEWEHTFPTGITGVDEVLDGGLSRGEMGVWIADAKGGKSIFLVHLAAFTARALRRKVLLILLEGSYLQTASRLDALHAQWLYAEVKRGEFDAESWHRIHHEYQALSQLLVIREMTDSWEYSASDIRSELDDLKAQHGWEPDEIICDYGDLLRSDGKASSEEEHQRNAFGALKTLTAQDGGYAIWTASQAQRPKTDWKKGGRKEEARDEAERPAAVDGSDDAHVSASRC